MPILGDFFRWLAGCTASRHQLSLYLNDLSDGFWIAEHFFPWGTQSEKVAAALGSSAEDRVFQCKNGYGFDTVSAELHAYPTHPVVHTVWYALAPASKRLSHPSRWMVSLEDMLGVPSRVIRESKPLSAHPAGCIREYANWKCAEQSVSLSLYGALRETPYGFSPGCLIISCSSHVLAQPYIEEWRSRGHALAALTPISSSLHHFNPGRTQQPRFREPDEEGDDQARREAEYILGTSDILPTPPSIAIDLDSQTFALWRANNQSHWYLSTLWDSIVISFDQPVDVIWYDMQPAKGSGYSEIKVGDWRVLGTANSPGIKEAMQMLAAIPNVRIKHHQGYDC